MGRRGQSEGQIFWKIMTKVINIKAMHYGCKIASTVKNILKTQVDDKIKNWNRI